MGKCEYCGKSTPFKMPLCKEHYDMQQAGTLKKDSYGNWILTKPKKEVKEEIKTTEIAYEKCIVCGAESNGRPQCADCYNETLDFMDGLDKNTRAYELRDYYYNLKDRIYRIKNYEYVKSNCNKLIAIAIQNKKTNSDQYLTDIVYKDIAKIFESKKQKEGTEKTETKNDEDNSNDENKERLILTYDGHMVKSNMEMDIDDILWSANIIHAYGKSIIEFTERKKCDWFIPIIGSGPYQGIYVEYWGMKTAKYLKDRQEKEELYKKYKVPYVGIEKDAPNNKNNFRDILIREIREKAKENFKFMPIWCNPEK